MRTRRTISLIGILFFVFACLAGSVCAQSLAELTTKLQSGSSEEKRDALLALRSLRSEEASRVAAAALRDRSAIVRATAASSVFFLPKSEAAAALSPLLRDKDEFVRSEGAYALGEVGDLSATTSLINAMTDRSQEVRSAAAVALGKLGDPAAISPLTSILDRTPTEDTEMLRRAAARSIGQIAQIIYTNNKKVVTPQNFLPPHYKTIKTLGASQIDIPKFDAAAKTLTRVLTSDSEAADTRREAAFSLGAMRYGGASSVLGQYLSGADPYMAEICKEALIKIRSVE